jgi:bacillithiol system protein YtxJ
MGLFDGMFGKKSTGGEGEAVKVLWKPLVSEMQLDEIPLRSKERAQVIFKHSTTCGISRMVLNMFTSQFELKPEEADVYFLDLHAHRAISNSVAERFGVVHQSPQLLIIKNGEVTAHASHGEITEVPLKNYV